jgi:hypothetical protein
MGAMFGRIAARLGRQGVGGATEMTVQATLRCRSARLGLRVHSGQMSHLDMDGRTLRTQPARRCDLDVPLSELERYELTGEEMFKDFDGKMVLGRIYLVGGRIEFLEVSTPTGAWLTWSARPGWCDLHR